jgi:hypothetical protein
LHEQVKPKSKYLDKQNIIIREGKVLSRLKIIKDGNTDVHLPKSTVRSISKLKNISAN